MAAGRARARATAYIDRHLGDRDLSAATVARRIGVSRSVLYRLFEPAGGVTRFVQQRRVAQLRRSLSRPDEHRTVDELATASGFTSPSHAGRLFRDAFGVPPGEYRRGARALPTRTGPVRSGSRTSLGPASRRSASCPGTAN